MATTASMARTSVRVVVDSENEQRPESSESPSSEKVSSEPQPQQESTGRRLRFLFRHLPNSPSASFLPPCPLRPPSSAHHHRPPALVLNGDHSDHHFALVVAAVKHTHTHAPLPQPPRRSLSLALSSPELAQQGFHLLRSCRPPSLHAHSRPSRLSRSPEPF